MDRGWNSSSTKLYVGVRMMIDSITFAFICAVCSLVYCCILTESGMIFFALPDIIRMAVFNPCKSYEEQPVRIAIYKILIECEKCNCGQLALWSYLVYAVRHGLYESDWLQALAMHAFTICMAIFIIIPLKKIYLWASN